jgi:shikimate dehydrogenase
MAGPVGAPRRAAVLGHPIAHSLSPALHGAAYAALGLDGWTYEALNVTASDLPDVVGRLDGTWAGLSLTMPLKTAVLPLLDHVEPLAAVVGAVNTVLVQPAGSGVVLTGANTDVHGLVSALREGLAAGAAVRTAVVLGAGATACSTLAALAELGVPDPVVLVRSPARAGALLRAAHRMGVHPRLQPLRGAPEAMVRADVVVATLPPGAGDDLAGPVAELAGGGAGREQGLGVLLDVAYDPRRSRLAHAWAAAGGTAVDGERMLLHQAAEQVRLMTGRPAPLAAMDEALVAALPG